MYPTMIATTMACPIDIIVGLSFNGWVIIGHVINADTTKPREGLVADELVTVLPVLEVIVPIHGLFVDKLPPVQSRLCYVDELETDEGNLGGDFQCLEHNCPF